MERIFFYIVDIKDAILWQFIIYSSNYLSNNLSSNTISFLQQRLSNFMVLDKTPEFIEEPRLYKSNNKYYMFYDNEESCTLKIKILFYMY